MLGAGALVALGSKAPAPAAPPAAMGGTNHPVLINRPKGAPRVTTGQTNYHGAAVTISCSTCHSSTTPNPQVREAAQLEEFHQGMKFNHGGISCLSCHNQTDYDTLRLADGMRVEFQNVMQLCSQCHGPQARDYRNGSHGGMTGHWDLTKGGRQRNNCTDCHDPHAPQYPVVLPVFPQEVPNKIGLHGAKPKRKAH